MNSTERHPDADRRGLGLEEFWEAFLHEHRRVSGLKREDFNYLRDMEYYYRATTTPAEAVAQDIKRFKL